MRVALSIAGSDSGGGAGIQADLKTFAALGVHGCTAVTAITAQNTKKVCEIFEIEPGIVSRQIRSILTDIPPDAIKIGMVYSKSIVQIVRKSLAGTKVPIVLDPIFEASTGVKLILDNTLESFISELIPLCTVITPNIAEASRLANIRINSEVMMIKAAEIIKSLGAKNVIIKGGHLERKTVTDLLLDNSRILRRVSNRRISNGKIHGSGCNLSSAITAFLANGFSLSSAHRAASGYVHEGIENATMLGKGIPVANPVQSQYEDANRYRTHHSLQQAVNDMQSVLDFVKLIPETQSNFVYAVPNASSLQDVAAVSGRIVTLNSWARAASCVEFGASRHVASAILAYMESHPTIRSAINIKFDRSLLRICKSLFSVANYDRGREPSDIKKREGSTIYWGVRHALARNPGAEVIYHTGDFAKEPMILIFAKNPTEVITKIKMILDKYTD